MTRYELLTDILGESVEDGEYAEDLEEDASDELIEDEADFYAELDEQVEDALRASLRETIMQDERLSDSQKVKTIELIENSVLSDEQLYNFLESVIEPILHITGVTSEGYEPEYAIHIPMAIYEMSIALNGGISNTLYESMFSESEQEEIKGNVKLIFESYDISEKSQKVAVLEIADSLKEFVGSGILYPAFEDVADFVLSISEDEELLEGVTSQFISMYENAEEQHDLANEVAKRKKAEYDKKSLFGKAASKLGDFIGDKKMDLAVAKGRVKDAAAAVSKKAKDTKDAIKSSKAVEYISNKTEEPRRSLNNFMYRYHPDKEKYVYSRGAKTAAGAVGAVALTAASIYAWRKFKNRKCAGLSGDEKNKCLAAAAEAAIKTAKTSLDSCATEKCKKSALKQVSKWQAVKSKYTK